MTTPSISNHGRLYAGRASLERLSTWAVLAGVCGLVAAVGPLPTVVKTLLLVVFVFVGPGAAGMHHWQHTMPVVATRALVPVLGLAVVFLILTLSLMLGGWSPRVVLLAMSAATVVAGVVNRRVFDERGDR